MFHLHYKPLWSAIDEADSRFRKRAAQGRMIERVMLLDAVLEDRSLRWLGPAGDKRKYFLRAVEDKLSWLEFPRLRFGDAPKEAVRYFPDNLPVGVQPDVADQAVFVYLVSRPSPWDFRLFLLRHVALLRVLSRWTIRLLFPKPLVKARHAYLRAVREHLAMTLDGRAEMLENAFRERRQFADPKPSSPDQPRRQDNSVAFDGPRFRALYQQWLVDPETTIRMANAAMCAACVHDLTGVNDLRERVGRLGGTGGCAPTRPAAIAEVPQTRKATRRQTIRPPKLSRERRDYEDTRAVCLGRLNALAKVVLLNDFKCTGRRSSYRPARILRRSRYRAAAAWSRDSRSHSVSDSARQRASQPL
jgi:hypothetical protein